MKEEGISTDGQRVNDAIEYQLSVMRKKDVKVFMDNKPITLDEALYRCVQECSVYMPDYVLDENGILEQVRFDKINM